MATSDSNKMVKPYKAGSPVKKKTMPMKPGMSSTKKPAVRVMPSEMVNKPSRNAPKRVGTLPKPAPKGVPSKPKSEAAKQLSVLNQPLAARRKKEAAKKAAVVSGRRAAASVPTGRGASGAAAGKTTKGTVTRGKSNFVLEALRNAANSMTTNREKAINEKYWQEGGNRPAAKPIGKRATKSVKPKGK